MLFAGNKLGRAANDEVADAHLGQSLAPLPVLCLSVPRPDQLLPLQRETATWGRGSMIRVQAWEESRNAAAAAQREARRQAKGRVMPGQAAAA